MSRAEQVASLRYSGMSDAKIADELGVSVETVRRYGRMAGQFGVIAEVIEKPIEGPEADELWEMLEARNEKNLSLAASQNKATFRIDTDAPVSITFLTDQHFGGNGVDMKRAREDAELIRDTPGAFAILGGDLLDNFLPLKLAKPVRDSSVTIRDQWKLVEHYLDMFGGKILAIVGGNHEAWSDKYAGVDVLADLAKQKRILHDAHQWLLTLKIGGQPYQIGIRHKARFNSSYNETHSAKQLLRMGVFPPSVDVVVLGHTHAPSLETFKWAGRKRIVARAGSYKVKDSYVLEQGFSGGGYMIPSVVFWPGEHRICAVEEIDSAMEFLNSLRGEGAKEA